jgi:hypothetical protein
MSIRYIDSISIDGRGNSPERKIFNGYIYNLNYNVALGDSKSSVTVNLVSEDGTYSITQNDLNYQRVYKIQLGSITFLGYLVNARKLYGPNEKLLELKFVDTSSKLDRFHIGLKNHLGQVSKDNIIVVGREIHPCDKDYDGDIDDIEDIVDECHPCRNQATRDAELVTINCQDLNRYMIFPVKYNFTMLMEAIRKQFKIDLKLRDPNPKYYTDYTGTVREVLQRWCADFGWIFYWEDESIKFLDLRRTLEINAHINDFCPTLSSYEEEWSIENTLDRIVATYYERAGSNDAYSCQDALYFQIPIYQPNRGDLGAELQITSKIPHEAAGLAQYNIALRDLWYWFDYYSLREPKDYKPGKSMPKVGLTILSAPIMLDGREVVNSDGLETGGLSTGSLETSSLEPSTGLHRPEGFPANPDPTSDLDFLSTTPPTTALQEVQALIKSNLRYKMCFELMTPEDQWIVANGLAKNKDDFFFFVGYYDEELHQLHQQEEYEYGREFLNKYHVLVPNMNDPVHRAFFEDYTFKEDEICNIKIRTNDEKISYNFLNTGNADQCAYFNTPTENADGTVDTLGALPFSKWLKIFRDTRDAVTAPNRERMFKMIVVSKPASVFYPSPSVRYNGEEDEERIKDEIQNTTLITLAAKNSLIILGQKNNEQGEFIPRKVTENTQFELNKSLDRTKIYVILGRSVQATDYRMTNQTVINPTAALPVPFDGKPIKTDYEDEFDTKGETIYQYESLKCNNLGNLSVFAHQRSFKTPVATFTYFEPTYADYGVVLEKTKLIKRKIDKLQVPVLNKTKISDKVASIQVVERNISDDEIRIFKNKNNSCRYDLEKIRNYHKDISKHLEFTYDKPIVTKQFTIEGIEINKVPKIENGLISIDVSLGEEGVKTSYVLGTRLMQPISEELIISLANTTSAKGQYELRPLPSIKPISDL